MGGARYASGRGLYLNIIRVWAGPVSHWTGPVMRVWAGPVSNYYLSVGGARISLLFECRWGPYLIVTQV